MLCQGFVVSMLVVISWNLASVLYQLYWEEPESWTLQRLFVLTLPAQVGGMLLGFFFSSGAYDVRIRYAASRLKTLNDLLEKFHISYCSDSGRLRMRP